MLQMFILGKVGEALAWQLSLLGGILFTDEILEEKLILDGILEEKIILDGILED